MEEVFKFVARLLTDTITTVFTSLYHNWLPLSLAIFTAAAMKVYVDTEKLKRALLKRPNVSITASVAFGAFTPLCACGTMAVVIGLFTTALPWGPIMAFLTSSPLMSPDAFILLAGIVGVKFAVALAIASVIIGLGSGYLTNLIDTKTDFLKNQTRFSTNTQVQACACSEPVPAPAPVCGRSAPAPATVPVQTCGCPDADAVPGTPDRRGRPELLKKIKLRKLGEALLNVGLKQILLYFSIFVGIGYLIQSFVPTSLIMALFSPDSIFSVPLAALIGLPLYVSGESAIPLINVLLAGGAGGGAMLAFMITGQATSAWVIAGITAFMKRRVIGLYIAFILAGGILLGYLYDILLTVGI
jgi:uncharacterized membrane protein YraQ (UPF0718 family)